MSNLREAAQAVIDARDNHGYSPALQAAMKELCNALIEPDMVLAALEGMMAIVDDSQGVAGYHLNGEIAEWDEFEEVDAARAAIAVTQLPKRLRKRRVKRTKRGKG